MIEEKGIVYEVADMYAAYSVQKVVGDLDRVYLHYHSDQTRVFLNPASYDKAWKEQYFFISGH